MRTDAPPNGDPRSAAHAWHCEVFLGDDPRSGNPALVVPWLPVEGRADYPVVVGFDPARPTAVCFAAPGGPLPFCGHGSIAVAWVLGQRLGTDRLELQTPAQTVRAEVSANEARIHTPPARRAEPVEPPPGLVASLGLDGIRGCHLADAGSPKWIVEVALPDIDRLDIDRPALAELSRRHGVNGVYVVANTGPGRYRARAFNPRTSAGEDRATGVAVAGLAACLGGPVVVDQGPPGQPLARLQASLTADGIVLSGAVVGHRREAP
ncbi:MAG: PhzF family phenazine biosynthesis protein [Alphaproteobacteria bacterium]|nr:PhzF family phenazine biosynthesis protein [Alphaproteobacteria bacterium]